MLQENYSRLNKEFTELKHDYKKKEEDYSVLDKEFTELKRDYKKKGGGLLCP